MVAAVRMEDDLVWSEARLELLVRLSIEIVCVGTARAEDEILKWNGPNVSVMFRSCSIA